MNKRQRGTVIFLIFYLALGVGYDIWVAMQPDGGKKATISFILSWSFQQWWGVTLAVAFGILIGHFIAQDGRLQLDGSSAKE